VRFGLRCWTIRDLGRSYSKYRRRGNPAACYFHLADAVSQQTKPTIASLRKLKTNLFSIAPIQSAHLEGAL
jgi:hypothetical protein